MRREVQRREIHVHMEGRGGPEGQRSREEER